MFRTTAVLETAIETLRAEGAPPHARQRLLDRLLRNPRRRTYRFPVMIAATSAAAMALLVLPQESSGCNASCVLKRSTGAYVKQAVKLASWLMHKS